MIHLDEVHTEWLKRRAFQSAPQEACGFLMKDMKFLEIPNSAINPFASFAMSSKDLTEKLGVERISEILGIWHTHPSGSPLPSADDMKSMYQGEWDWHYIIATKNEVNVWEPGFFTPKDNSFWKEFSKHS